MPKKKELWSTFRGNNSFPVYNWFYFTEAYSRGLVRNIFLKYNKEKAIVLDPFCGTGTTLLVAKEFGFDAVGLDVSPLMVLISKIKTMDYDLENLDNYLEKILKNDEKAELKEKWIKKFFYAKNLEDLLKYKKAIDDIKEKEKYFFYGVLLKTLQTVTRAEKRGSALRIRKIKELDTEKVFLKHFKQFKKDLKKLYKRIKKTNIKVVNDSALNLTKYVDKVDYIICSPPYPNKTEYVRRMGIELSFFGYESLLREHLGTKAKKKLKKYLYISFFEKEIEKAKGKYKLNLKDYNLDNYFIGLENFINDSYSVLKDKGILSVTIAGGCFKDFSLDIYDYLKNLFEFVGFSIKEIKLEREILCHKNRTEKIGKIKEFTIIGEKVK